MFTVTGPEALIVVSGKVKGFALIVMPLMLVTRIEEGGEVGVARTNGVDNITRPPTSFAGLTREKVNASMRTTPSPPPKAPPRTSMEAATLGNVIAGDSRRTAPPLPPGTTPPQGPPLLPPRA